MPVHETPVYSVIIPVHNRAGMIRECVHSVFAQSFSQFEIICIDNGSDDGTAEVLESLKREDDRLRVISQPNRGRCAARNAGLDAARGEWICFLDSDDQYYPNHLEIFQHLIGEKPGCNAFAIELKHKGRVRIYPDKRLYGTTWITFEDFVEHNPLSILQVSYRRSALQALRFYDGGDLPIAEDLLFLRELTLQEAIYKTDIVTVEVKEHEQRTMNSYESKQIAFFNVRSTELFLERNNIDRDTANRMKLSVYLLAANLYADGRDLKSARGYIYKASSLPFFFLSTRFYISLGRYLFKSLTT